MGESRCPLCGSMLVRGVRLAGVETPGTAAGQVVFHVSCQKPGCVWQQEERVA